MLTFSVDLSVNKEGLLSNVTSNRYINTLRAGEASEKQSFVKNIYRGECRALKIRW